MTKPPSYSWSAIEMFYGGPTHGGCPLAYKLVRIDKIPRADSEPLIIGRDSHLLSAKYLTRLIATGQTTDWEYAASLVTPVIHPDAAEIFQRFYENFVMPPVENPGIELQLAFNRAWKPCDYHAPDVFFRMVLDWTFRQDGLGVVIDFKSNRAIIEIDPGNIPLQLRIYAWGALHSIFPRVQEILLRLHFLRYGVDLEILLTPDALATVPQELEALVAQIEAEKHFKPRPGSYCQWCGVQSHCPKMANALIPVEVMAPATRAQAEKAAELLLAIDEISKALKDRLKEWVRENGAVMVGDMVYGPIQSTSYDLDPQEITEFLLNDLEPAQVWPLLNLTKTSLERGLKKLKRKDLLDKILAQATSKTIEKVQFTKVK